MPFNRILLAISDEGQRELYQESLQEEGFSVQVAADGEEAMDLFQIEGQDVVVADTTLPKTAGIKLLETIHEINPYCGKILVADSDEDLEEHKETLTKLGAEEVLRRPFNVITLLCSIEHRVEVMKDREAQALVDVPESPDIKLREQEIKIQDQRSKIRDLTRELGLREGLEDKLGNLRNLVRQKEKELSAVREELNHSRDEMSRHIEDEQKKSDLYQKTIDGLMGENRILLEDFEKKVIHHNKQLQLLSTDSEEVSSAYERKIAELETELEVLRKRAKELEEQKEKNDSSREDFEKSLHEKLMSREDEFKKERESFEGTVSEREDRIKTLEEQLDETTSKVRALELERDEQGKDHTDRLADSKREHQEAVAELTRKHQEELVEIRKEIQPEKAKVKTLLSYQQTIIRNIFSAFLSVDHREKITMANQLLSTLLNVSLGKLIGEKVSAVKELEAVYPFYKNAMENDDEVDGTEIFLTQTDGTTVPVMFRCKKVRFGKKDMCLLLFNPIEEKADKGAPEPDEAALQDNPIYAFGASVAADVVDVKDQLLSLRSQIEKAYALTPPDTALRESVNLLLNDIGDLLSFTKSITDKAEEILS